MPYRTLGELRSIILARLGMGGMGASGGANGTMIDSMLQNGQTQLYWTQEWRHLTDYKDLTTGVGQNLYDYPTAGSMQTVGCSTSKRILRVETLYSGQFSRIPEGISTGDWSNMETRGAPARFERFAQILVYPKSDSATYTMRVWFIRDLDRFTETSDRATLDDEMIILHATANAKSHYRQPDAAVYQGQLNTLLAGLRGQSFSSDRVYRRGTPVPAERRPAVVGRDV